MSYPSSMETTRTYLTAANWSRGVILIWALPVLTVLTILTIIRSISTKKRHHSSIDTTSNQLTAPYSFSCSSSPPSWDVFLSFYGKDTRRNFTSHLYFALDQEGIKTFMDDHELEKGEEISQALLKAIHVTKKFVVVLSENYARSPWCLDELVEILGSKKTKNQVIPVFYYVYPSDVRYQKGSFGEALDLHKRRYSVDVIEKWKAALAEIAELSGYHLKKDANENESDTIQEIVSYVAPQTYTKVLLLEEYLSGIDSAVEDIYQKLSMESNDVRAIGIYGMGGIGKTTAAKAFYNKYSNKFDISCFIENVKQNSQAGNLLPLLKQLLIELHRRKDYKVTDVESGITQLIQILCCKKALIVLDDLDQSSYSELLVRLRNVFSAGSRIMITTRDANLLNQIKVDISELDIYKVKKLGQNDSLKLFSYHAFRKPVPPESFRELSERFVTYAGGLPLALMVLGSSLSGRNDVSFWKGKLMKVLEIPEKDIQTVLQLSYDELGDETVKNIFLDIVFFFIGKDKDEAVHIFQSCGFFPEFGIPILVDRCLLTIDGDDKFQMHTLIQDMGREIIREESKHGNWRYLYLRQGNACEALQNLEGADKIEGLILNQTMPTKRQMSAKIFEKLSKLRLLEIIDTSDIKGNFKNSFHELRCIRWRYCPWTCLPSSFRPQKLVCLDMPFSEFKTLWKGSMPSANLKNINVSYSKNLKITPDFNNSRLVEKLLLHGCKNLLKIHPSIAQLTVLGCLDLFGCVKLKKLPEAVKQLTNLRSLELGLCHNLNRLPEQLGDMTALKMLDARLTSIEQLPNSVVHLKELVTLNFYGCSMLRKLPEQFGNMEGLRTVVVSYCAIEQLPDSIGGLINLVDLDLSNCQSLASLPNSIWKLKFLQVLKLGYCSKLERLPEQLGRMQCLERLIAPGTSIKEIPDSIGLLSRLRELDLNCSEKIKYLPNSIWNLTSLADFFLPGEVIVGIRLPDTVKNMKLQWSTRKFIIRLCLPIIDLTDEGQSISSTRSSSLPKPSILQYLTLYSSTSLGSFFPELPLNLQGLEVYNNATLEQLPDLSRIKLLKKLDIRKFSSLKSLPPLPPHVRSLTAHECTSLQYLPDLSTLMQLQTLSFITCSNLKSVCVKQNSLQVRDLFSSFKADIPNKEVAEWFSYKSNGPTVSFDIPPSLGDDFLGVALWVVYKCKSKTNDPTVDCLAQHFRAVITNKRMGITKNYNMYSHTDIIGEEIQSRVECTRGKDISVKSGDRINVSFQRLIYFPQREEVRELNVKMCGAHVIRKIPTTPPQQCV